LPYWNSGLGKSWGDGQLPNKRQGVVEIPEINRVISRLYAAGEKLPEWVLKIIYKTTN